jgi:glycosyltransferase involved in cell wall biosynthesis
VLFLESRFLKRGTFDPIGALRQRLLTDAEREVFRRARDMIIISRYLPDIYGSMLQARTHFIENPIGGEFFRIHRRPEVGRLLFVGTVVPRKRVHDLVAAVATLLRMAETNGMPIPAWHSRLELRVAGPLLDPGSEALVRGAIETASLRDKVSLLGAVSQSGLLDEYARAQVLLLASREETAPQVIAQAMACGLPTVASAVGGIPAMLRDGDTGLLYPLSDVDACARQIFRILNDANLRSTIEDKITRQARERFHADSVAQQTAAVYHELASRTLAGSSGGLPGA